MNDPLRAFVAIEPQQRLIDALGLLTVQLKRVMIQPVTWVKPHNSHLTLRFLGEIDRSLIPNVVAAMQCATTKTHPFEIAIGTLGAFPSLRRPRVLWVGLTQGHDRLVSLKSSLDEALAAEGFQHEHREFQPHFTVGRVRYEPTRGREGGFVKMGSAPEASQQVAVVSLIGSALTPSGPVYTRIAEAVLVPCSP